MAHLCPACGWPHLHEAPRSAAGGGSYEICPSCGFQPGVTDDDEGQTPEGWRAAWIKKGMPWSSAGVHRPEGWNPGGQLQRFTGEK
jgi:hypothetical protein